ncbi:alpha/beta fold hydrolase [Catenuloplanes atrovinosus]|uniref:Pimeloyl-ACP methyl ester carboxylesterase n=1 Tax=Catenuloplanes atrovinosus TaxID=137266 RepID=A0AAE3YXC6_9ACTN|nr:alpha/beta fold hydrolase [Catenuloplanes atrovinosus]MDR7280330.1 pimeloyl-ACP methyl ester carboxylesterase [Catenuloplanes atrovinosus]
MKSIAFAVSGTTTPQTLGEAMFRHFKTSAVLAMVAVAAAGAAIAGQATPAGAAVAGQATPAERSIDVGGKSVHVSCSGVQQKHRPVVVLMAGLGDGTDRMAALQQALSRSNRVCSYDRLGEGRSDQPDRPQTIDSTGAVLTKVIGTVSGGRPVVLAGHSLGGLIAARYAPDHKREVSGVVLMDATSPTMMADVERAIPESATGFGAELRAQTLAVFRGENPERLVIGDGPVRSAGDIPVEVVQHGKPYLAEVPEYGAALEQAWGAGQRAWLGLSCRADFRTAANSGHYIYLDEPEVAVQAVQRVVTKASRR